MYFVLVYCVLVLCTATQAGVKLISLPSKRLGLYTTAASTIIARSDSNGEDLEAFAGAGMQTSFIVLFLRVPSYMPAILCILLVAGALYVSQTRVMACMHNRHWPTSELSVT